MRDIFANVKFINDTKKVCSASFVFYFQLHDFSDEEILITGDNWCPVNSKQQDKQVGFMLDVDSTGLKERQVLTLASEKSVLSMNQIGGISSKKYLFPQKSY